MFLTLFIPQDAKFTTGEFYFCSSFKEHGPLSTAYHICFQIVIKVCEQNMYNLALWTSGLYFELFNTNLSTTA
jgi:hypothetical protein